MAKTWTPTANGRPLGWFIEHKADIWKVNTFSGDDGPYTTRVAAVQGMIDHLRTTIVRVRSWRDA
ncbi:MAG TPA: hypothetical protein VND98_07100 [Solirubrobacterales bacterium]|nr:hypothetical protein [Solirubrobacterales bacterium]